MHVVIKVLINIVQRYYFAMKNIYKLRSYFFIPDINILFP